MERCGAQQPGAVVPDPVAFGELFEKWDEELEVFFDEEADLLLWEGQPGFLCCLCIGVVRRGIHVGLRGDFAGEDILQDQSTIVPDRVVLGVLS